MNRLNFKQLAERLSDENLLLALAQGEEEALSIFYQRHSGKVLRFCLKKGFSKESADEILQIVFLQLWRKRAHYSAQYKALAWLYILTKSETKDYRNREKTFARTKSIPAEEFMTDASQNDDFSPIKRQEELSWEGLSEVQKDVLTKRFYEDKEFSEIALALGKSESNIRKIISRAFQVLRSRKEEEK